MSVFALSVGLITSVLRRVDLAPSNPRRGGNLPPLGYDTGGGECEGTEGWKREKSIVICSDYCKNEEVVLPLRCRKDALNTLP